MKKNILFIILWFLFFSCQIMSLFATEYNVINSEPTPQNEKRKNIISTLLKYYSKSFTYSSLAVVIDKELIEPRARIYGSRISVSSHVLRDGEFIKLFVHEFWHYVDLFVFPLFSGSDVSDTFYSFSWKDTTVKLPSEWLSSFVSGYAATNKYEDFAESFTFYIFHNAYFADRALKNESLRKKYLFFGEKIFTSWQFVGTDYSLSRVPSYIWDTTKVPISLQKYLYSLN